MARANPGKVKTYSLAFKQAAYDTEVAERELASTLRRIKPWVGTAA